VELDSKLVEHVIRRTALGKKNWLFNGGAQAGQSSAIIYTVIESCRYADWILWLTCAMC
jgi:transposase